VVALSNGSRPTISDGEEGKCSPEMWAIIQNVWHPLPIERPSCDEFLQSPIKEETFTQEWEQPEKIEQKEEKKQKETEKEMEKEVEFDKEEERGEDRSLLLEIMAVLQQERKDHQPHGIGDSGRIRECTIIKPEKKERSHMIEEKECIVVEADQSGTITCLVSIQPPASSSRLSAKKMKWAGIVGGTSRGWILSWNSKVILSKPQLSTRLLTPNRESWFILFSDILGKEWSHAWYSLNLNKNCGQQVRIIPSMLADPNPTYPLLSYNLN